ncbi:hypothetical protein V8F20_007762 [Naviculisporaceae sp. PSN 640]
MSSKRTAAGFKKAVAASGGQGQLRQTTLFSFVKSSPSSSKPRQDSTDQPAPSSTTSAPSTEDAEEDSPRARKVRLPAGFDFSKEASKENRAPPSPHVDQDVAPSRPLQAQSQDQTADGTRTSGGTLNPPATAAGDLIRITDIQGDLFSAPPNTVLIHACNSIGSWGGGIALAFKKFYPEAFKVYAAHCKRYAADPRKLVGTALLIPPPATGSSTGSGPNVAGEIRKQHWIGCLFTSKAYGRGRDSPRDILRATGPAMGDLMRMIAEKRKERKMNKQGGPGEIRMCQINSGLFSVPWAETKRVLGEMRAEDIVKECEDSEISSELGDLPVHIEAYWRPDK